MLEFVVYSHPVLPDGFAQGRHCLVMGIILVDLQRFQTLKLADQHRVIVVLTHMDCHFALQQFGNHTLQAFQALQKLFLFRFSTGAELPHHDMPDHASAFLALYASIPSFSSSMERVSSSQLVT